jgi:hypothetical protein
MLAQTINLYTFDLIMRPAQTKESLHKKVRINKRTGCWNFTGAISKTGYGVVGLNKRVINAHRASWILSFGEIPSPTIQVCHKCDNRKCINPDHLFLGTAKDNYKDMVIKGRWKSRSTSLKPRLSLFVCMRGHDFTPENSIYNKKGHKTCRICHNERQKNYNSIKRKQL